MRRLRLFRPRQCLALCLAAAVWHVSSLAAAVPEANRPGLTGDLFTSGRVLLDGSEVVNGSSFFSGSEVRTEEGARALLGLGRSGRAELLPQSSLTVEFADEGVSCALGAGGLRFSKPAGATACVKTGGGSVTAGADADAVFTVRYEEGHTSVETQTGKVRLRLKDREVTVAAGESYAEGQDAPSASNSLSGKKKAGIFVAIAGGITLLLLILIGNDNNEEPVVVTPPGNPSP
jgi:ferric-dicitrate binding protein FerR (iron transport regulator)